MHKLKNKLFSSLLSLFLLTFPFAAPSQGQGANKLPPDQVEKVHNRLFPKGPKGEITDMLARTTGDVNVPCVVPVWQRVMVPFVDELGMLASKSDLDSFHYRESEVSDKDALLKAAKEGVALSGGRSRRNAQKVYVCRSCLSSVRVLTCSFIQSARNPFTRFNLQVYY